MTDTTTPSPASHKDAKAQAKAAKAYAKAQRPTWKKKRFIIPVAGIAIVAVATQMGGGSEDTGADKVDAAVAASNAKGGEAKADAPKTVKVEAKNILKEFEENEAAADAKYKGKMLEVTGVIAGVDTEVWDEDEYIVEIGSGSDFEFLYVNADDQTQADVADLKVGDKITVIGEFEDGGDLGVELSNSQIVG